MQRIAESLPPPKHKRSTDEVFSEPQRLHKVLASCGFGSRRAMEEMILAGRITVNRMPAEVGQKVGPDDEVRINGEVVRVRFSEPRPRVLMYHKPAGELVTRDDPEGRPTVFEKLPSIGNGRWINVGRLDYNTEGLLLFTNSGELANRMTHPRYEVEREYAVRVMGRLSDEQMRKLVNGIQLDDGPARCEKVTDAGGDEDGSNHWYHVVLKEGRNREVRRLFEALGLMVSRLIRTRFGMIAMPSAIKRGQLVELEAPQVDELVASAGLRSQPRPGPRPKPRHGTGAPAKSSHHAGPPSRRPPHPHRDHPRMQGNGADAQAVSRETSPRVDASAGEPRRAQPHPRKRPWKKHRGGKPVNAQPQQPRGPQHDQRRSGPKPHAQPGRPSRPRNNFDEMQPQSNANASPFGRTTLTVPGGAPRGFGNERPRGQRSGPRARHAGKGNGNGARTSGAAFRDRVELAEPGYKAPKRPVTHTEIRSKRTRTIVKADVAADASESPALRRLLIEGKS
ncbi:MAG TPA: pseudouridine synthase [Casimicrobiaceae bacterium]|nr:pseudouridine synthase [Casimicrobiaceae bacterium]